MAAEAPAAASEAVAAATPTTTQAAALPDPLPPAHDPSTPMPAQPRRRLSGDRVRLPIPDGSAHATAHASAPSPAAPVDAHTPTHAEKGTAQPDAQTGASSTEAGTSPPAGIAAAPSSSPASSPRAALSSSAPARPAARPFVAFLRCSVLSYRSRVRAGKQFSEFQLTIHTPALHWDAYKRYSEFASLHKAVLELVASDPRLKADQRAGRLQLPRLPPSKLMGNLKDNFLQERMQALNTYMGELLAVEQLHTCMPVLEFLGALQTSKSATVPVSASAAGASASGTSDAAARASRPHASLPRLHLDAVVKLLDAGDVVLFRTSGTLQSLQRTFTGSRYDHVGMVIRIPWGSIKPSALHLLESTSDGVRTYQLARRMRAWYMSNAVVVVRQLKGVRRSDAFLAALDSFVSDVDGLPYGLTLGKLLRREPGASKDNFFCSELVATAYMRTGLLSDASHSATAFYPSDFNEHNSKRLLNLEGGAELGPELLVDFIQPAIHEAKQNGHRHGRMHLHGGAGCMGEGLEGCPSAEECEEGGPGGPAADDSAVAAARAQSALAARVTAANAAARRQRTFEAARRQWESRYDSRILFSTSPHGSSPSALASHNRRSSMTSPPMPLCRQQVQPSALLPLKGKTAQAHTGVTQRAPLSPPSSMHASSPGYRRSASVAWQGTGGSLVTQTLAHSLSSPSLAIARTQDDDDPDDDESTFRREHELEPGTAEEEEEEGAVDSVAVRMSRAARLSVDESDPIGRGRSASQEALGPYVALASSSMHAAASAAAAAAYAAADPEPSSSPSGDTLPVVAEDSGSASASASASASGSSSHVSGERPAALADACSSSFTLTCVASSSPADFTPLGHGSEMMDDAPHATLVAHTTIAATLPALSEDSDAGTKRSASPASDSTLEEQGVE